MVDDGLRQSCARLTLSLKPGHLRLRGDGKDYPVDKYQLMDAGY